MCMVWFVIFRQHMLFPSYKQGHAFDPEGLVSTIGCISTCFAGYVFDWLHLFLLVLPWCGENLVRKCFVNPGIINSSTRCWFTSSPFLINSKWIRATFVGLSWVQNIFCLHGHSSMLRAGSSLHRSNHSLAFTFSIFLSRQRNAFVHDTAGPTGKHGAQAHLESR